VHRALKGFVALAVGAALLVGTPAVSSAQVGPGGGGRGRSSGDGPPDFEGGGSILHPVPGMPGLPGDGTTSTCTAPDGTTGPIEHRPPPESQQYYFDHASQYFAPGGQYAGTWYARYCGGSFDQIVFVPTGGTGPALGLLEDVVALSVEAPDIQMSPDEHGRQLVGLESWLWIDQWQGAHTESHRYPGLDISIDATPGTVTWDLGDGTAPFDCDAGTPYDPAKGPDQQTSDCHHVYTRSSAHEHDGTYSVRATVHWSARVTVNGVQLPQVLTADKTSTMAIRVGERQALNRTPGRT
jgi:hypothetical protein